MNYLCVIGVLVCAAALAAADTTVHPRGCIYILGKCSKECPEGTHAYALGCGYKTPEPTCRQPTPVAEQYMLCDYSACYCDPPTVRDEKTNKCVLKEDCSPQDQVTTPSTLPPADKTTATKLTTAWVEDVAEAVDAKEKSA